MNKKICISNKPCTLMKAITNARYGSKTILTDSCWEYVSLFLQRKSAPGTKDALFYWEQAHSFYLASQNLPDDAKPLTSYYCILNASKAMLRYYGVEDKKLNMHGISTVNNGNVTNLNDAKTKIKGSGVLPELAKHFDCNVPVGQYSIQNLLYNIPCVHRAFCITYSKPEIYIPICEPVFVKKDDSKEAWIQFEIKSRYANAKAIKSIPTAFEHDLGIADSFIIRMKKRFNWDIHKTMEERKQKLGNYHKRTRKYLSYISGETKLWYIKKVISGNEDLHFIQPSVLIFAVFHWLSELVRYNPQLFNKYMKSKQNWLIHEFINEALDQVVDEIGCEITGTDIMCTGYRK